jgi:UDPglucose--hexose-1-phosphate uridylyltransferase
MGRSLAPLDRPVKQRGGSTGRRVGDAKEGPELRVDRLSRTPVVVTGGRQGRPNRPDGSCPFCVGGLEAPDPYDVRWFPNRWPPLPDGRAEVLLYGPEHGKALWQLGRDAARRVVDLWADRTAALGAREDCAYVLLFENRGAEVGATIDHPHGQAYGFAEVPQAPLRELTTGRCWLCEPPAERLVVKTSGRWRAWCPEASSYAYELRIAPTDHLQALPALPEEDRDALADVLVDVLARLDQLFDAPMPYMLWWHQRPNDGGEWPLAHVHCHVAPLLRAPGTARYVAAGELGSGVFFNPVVPEDAAQRLRSLKGA